MAYHSLNSIIDMHVEISNRCNAACPMCVRFHKASPHIRPDLTIGQITLEKFKKWIPNDELIYGPFGTMEPKKNQISVFPQILVVPLLSFDREFYRLGYGGGYYDKSISDLKKHFKKERKFFISFLV